MGTTQFFPQEAIEFYPLLGVNPKPSPLGPDFYFGLPSIAYHVLACAVKLRAREIIHQICIRRELYIQKGHVSKDHVHLLISSPPHISVSETMQKIKGRSSRMLQQEFPHLGKRYWGQHLWARGYFALSVGQVTEQMISDYIEGHMEKPPDED